MAGCHFSRCVSNTLLTLFAIPFLSPFRIPIYPRFQYTFIPVTNTLLSPFRMPFLSQFSSFDTLFIQDRFPVTKTLLSQFQIPFYPSFQYPFIPVSDTLFMAVSDTLLSPLPIHFLYQFRIPYFSPCFRYTFIPLSDTLFIPVSVPALSRAISTPAPNAAMHSCTVPCPQRQNRTQK